MTSAIADRETVASPARVADDDIVWINGFALPPAPKRRPIHAIVSVLRLMRNKEDTRQVFECAAALSGASGQKLFRRFTGTAYGRRVVSEPLRMERILSNRDWLRSLPEGSLGRAYLAFMEGENLTPEGLLSAAGEAGIDFLGETQFPEFQRMFLHISVLHDVWHVLTGYGRDPLGELCNLAFTRQQTGSPGLRLIIAIGLLAQKIEQPGLPLFKAVAEGARMGRNAEFILGHDVEALFALPLESARRQLGLIEPKVYKSVPDDLRRGLLKPRVNETQAERDRAALAV